MFFEALFLFLWTSTPDVEILTKLIHYKRLLWFSTQLFIFLVRSNTLAKLCVWRSVQKNHFCVFDVCPTETAQWSVINILRQKQKLNLCPIAAFWRKANPVLCGFIFFSLHLDSLQVSLWNCTEHDQSSITKFSNRQNLFKFATKYVKIYIHKISSYSS